MPLTGTVPQQRAARAGRLFQFNLRRLAKDVSNTVQTITPWVSAPLLSRIARMRITLSAK